MEDYNKAYKKPLNNTDIGPIIYNTNFSNKFFGFHGKIVGAWARSTKCIDGNGSFNLISLSVGLIKNYDPNNFSCFLASLSVSKSFESFQYSNIFSNNRI